MGEWVVGTIIGDYIIRDYYKDPFPHFLLRTREKFDHPVWPLQHGLRKLKPKPLEA